MPPPSASVALCSLDLRDELGESLLEVAETRVTGLELEAQVSGDLPRPCVEGRIRFPPQVHELREVAEVDVLELRVAVEPEPLQDGALPVANEPGGQEI